MFLLKCKFLPDLTRDHRPNWVNWFATFTITCQINLSIGSARKKALLTSYSVHCYSNGLMSFSGNSSQRHASSAKPLHNFCYRLDFINGYGWSSWDELQAVPQNAHWGLLKVFLVGSIRVLQTLKADLMLQLLGKKLASLGLLQLARESMATQTRNLLRLQ